MARFLLPAFLVVIGGGVAIIACSSQESTEDGARPAASSKEQVASPDEDVKDRAMVVIRNWVDGLRDLATDAVISAASHALDTGELRVGPTQSSKSSGKSSRKASHAASRNEQQARLPYSEAPEGALGPGNPEPLAPGEVSEEVLYRLVRKFNPAMVFTSVDVWPVEVGYLWAEGGGDLRRVQIETGLTGIPKTVPGTDEKVLDGALLDSHEWGKAVAFGAPAGGGGLGGDAGDAGSGAGESRATRTGGQYRTIYYVDGPGTNEGPGLKESSWLSSWRRIQGLHGLLEPTRAPYKPTQYAHVFWLDKERDLLAIQYWFFYPFNKFINNHEGDFEHINVIIKLEPEDKTDKAGAGKVNADRSANGAPLATRRARSAEQIAEPIRSPQDRFDPSLSRQEPVEYHYFAHGQGRAFFKNVVRVGDVTGSKSWASSLSGGGVGRERAKDDGGNSEVHRAGEGGNSVGGVGASSVQGDHPVVFVGGLGGLVFEEGGTVWGGENSGASWPAPAKYSCLMFPFATEDVRGWRRAIHASDFQIILLDEPARIDYEKKPWLSWLGLNFWAGEPETPVNPQILKMTGGHLAPPQPASTDSWLGGLGNIGMPADNSPWEPFQVPRRWKVLNNPYGDEIGGGGTSQAGEAGE